MRRVNNELARCLRLTKT